MKSILVISYFIGWVLFPAAIFIEDLREISQVISASFGASSYQCQVCQGPQQQQEECLCIQLLQAKGPFGWIWNGPVAPTANELPEHFLSTWVDAWISWNKVN